MDRSQTQHYLNTVRRFNRFYTAAIGTLQEGLLKSTLSLAEARVMYEIAKCDRPSATELAARLNLNMGYLSRILARFEERSFIIRRPSATDGRQSIISLTKAGRKEFAALDKQSDEQVAEMLAPLTPETQLQLVQAMTSIEHILRPDAHRERSPSPVILRAHRPGDMGWIVHRHGTLYAREYGWDERFEALVARITADFIDQYDAKRERCWIAERDGEFLGCVFLVKDRTTEGTAKLRMLLVEPTARGLGLGRTLVQQCTHFARQAGYSKIVLWTNSVLTAAHRIYEREGYRLVHQEKHQSFGKTLVGENWELILN